MKYRLISAALLFGGVFSFANLNAQSERDSTGLPGDNFSLPGALELFKKAKTPEEFEKMLNNESNKVNNLDLNGDGTVDYIRVIDKKDGDAHAIILQVPVSETENQDVAVIELEKTGPKEAVVQIVGDEDLYGEKTIVEPQQPDAAANFNDDESIASGPNYTETANSPSFIIINCWDWPFVQFVFSPFYEPWISPWDWYDRPIWYTPFRPMVWGFFYSRPRYYHYNYVYVNTRRNYRCQQIYRPYRRTSVYVRNRNSVVINRYRTNRSTAVYNRNNNEGRYNRGAVRGYDNRTYNNSNNNRVYRDRNFNNNGAENNRVYRNRSNNNYDGGNPRRIERNNNLNNGGARPRIERNNNLNNGGNPARIERTPRIERNNNNGGNVRFRNPNSNYRQPSERRTETRERRVERRDSSPQGNRSPRGSRPER